MDEGKPINLLCVRVGICVLTSGLQVYEGSHQGDENVLAIILAATACLSILSKILSRILMT